MSKHLSFLPQILFLHLLSNFFNISLTLFCNNCWEELFSVNIFWTGTFWRILMSDKCKTLWSINNLRQPMAVVATKWLEQLSHNLEVLSSNPPDPRAFFLFFFNGWVSLIRSPKKGETLLLPERKIFEVSWHSCSDNVNSNHLNMIPRFSSHFDFCLIYPFWFFLFMA